MSGKVKLQSGTTFNDAIPLINGAFDDSLSDISAFKISLGVINQYDSARYLTSGNSAKFTFFVFSTSAPDKIGGIQFTNALFVDSPQLPAVDAGTLDLSTLDPNDLFPTGSNVTGGKRSLVQFTYVMDMPDSFFNSNVKGTGLELIIKNGVRYYCLKYIYVIYIRNLDTITHGYIVAPNLILLKSPQTSQFR